MPPRITPLLLAAAWLAGCSSNEVLRGPVDVTIGQQLIDLKTAHDNGALSRDEYDLQRRRLVEAVR